MLRDLKRSETFWIFEGSRLCHDVYLSILSFRSLQCFEGDQTLLDQRPGIRCHRPDITCSILILPKAANNGTRRKTIMQVSACKLERNSDRWQMPGIPLASITAQTAPLPRCFVRSPLQIALGKLNPALQKNYAKLVLDLKNFLKVQVYIYICKQNPIHWNLLFTPPKDCILLELSGQIVTIFLGNCSGVC